MEISVTDVSPSKKNLNITVSPEEIQEKYNEKLSELNKNAHIPGFRMGKVPKRILDRKFGKGILNELKQVFIQDGFKQALEEHKLVPISIPDLNKEPTMQKGEPCTFEISVETQPEFKLPEYKGIEVKKPTVRVNNKEVDNMLKDMQKQRGELVPLDGASEEDDILICDANLKVDDELVWGKENLMVPVADTSIMGIVVGKKLLVGKKVKGICKKEVSIPEGFKLQKYVGKKGELSLVISDIKRIEMPELDDEFAKELKAEDLPDLKKKIREELKEKKNSQLNASVENEIMKAILKETEIELPEKFLEERVAKAKEDRKAELEAANKKPEEIKKTLKKEQNKIRSSITVAIKQHLLLEQIAKEEEIVVSDKDVDEHIALIAKREGKWPNEIKTEIEDKEAMEDFKSQVKHHKVLTFLREQAKTV